MRYWLLYRNGEYYIINRMMSGIIFEAIIQGCSSIASVVASSDMEAFRHLYAIALLHFLSKNDNSVTIV